MRAYVVSAPDQRIEPFGDRAGESWILVGRRVDDDVVEGTMAVVRGGRVTPLVRPDPKAET